MPSADRLHCITLPCASAGRRASTKGFVTGVNPDIGLPPEMIVPPGVAALMHSGPLAESALLNEIVLASSYRPLASWINTSCPAATGPAARLTSSALPTVANGSPSVPGLPSLPLAAT